MSIARISKVKDELTRTLLYEQKCEIQRLKQEVERLKRPTDLIGFHVKEGERALETAFKNVRHHVPD